MGNGNCVSENNSTTLLEEKGPAAYEGEGPYAFVCHAHADSEVFAEIRWLQSAGINVWYDRGVTAGSEWSDVLAQRILGCDWFLYFITQRSVDSEHCRRELNFAQEENKKVIAIHLEVTDVPPGVRLSLQNRQLIPKQELTRSSYERTLLEGLKPASGFPILGGPKKRSKKRALLIAFVAFVLTAALLLPADISRLWYTLPITDQSIAVLPLENLSPNSDNAFFAAGVHEEILNLLQQIPGIRVLSRPAVLEYQDSNLSLSDIALKLKVRYLMTGSVRFYNNQVRINLQLTQAADSVILWSAPYSRELNDIFAIQSDVALRVADAMKAALSDDEIANISRPVTESTEAYTLLLETRFQQHVENGLQSLDKDGWILSGIKRMERAVQLDPLFERGYAELGFLEVLRARIGPFEKEQDLFDRGVVYANKAIELNPDAGRAFQVLQIVAFERRRWDEWSEYAGKALEFPDRDGRAAFNYARDLITIGQSEEAYHWLDVAISSEPTLAVFRESSIEARIQGREYEMALIKAEEYRALGGDKNAYHVLRAYILTRLDQKSEALEELNHINSEPMSVVAEVVSGYQDYMRCQSSERESTVAAHQNINSEPLRELRIQYCAAGVGDVETIFESFQRIMSRGRNIYYAPGVFDVVNRDPRWNAVMEYMNWPTAVPKVR
jgi:TolB-like protein